MNEPQETQPKPEAGLQLGAAQGSAFRDRLEAMYAAIPWWKKVLTCCVLKRKQWKLARAHNKVACSMLLTDNHELGEAVRAAGDKLWAEIYERPNDSSQTARRTPRRYEETQDEAKQNGPEPFCAATGSASGH